jgi:hypothetical protein
MKRALVLISSMVLFVTDMCAADLPTEPFSYTADFETADPVKFWVGSSNYTLNFKGLTDEKCTGGIKSFKLDLTFGENSYIYWYIPMPRAVPSEGTLTFTGNIYVGAATTARVEVGPSYSYPPSTVSGTCPFMYRSATIEAWVPLQGDLVSIARTTNIAAYTWGNPTVDNTGRYLNYMLLRLYGNAGDRAVVYLDDFKVEGTVPVSADYSIEATSRWAPIKAMIDAKASEWETTLTQSSQELAIIKTQTTEAEQLKQDTLASVSSLQTRVDNVQARGAMTINEANGIESDTRDVNTACSILASIGTSMLAVTNVPPISSLPKLPDGLYGTASSKFFITAAQGEFEPASFIVHALRAITALTVSVENLRKGNKVIPASNIDIKVVKCWYQAGTAWTGINQNKATKVIVPELLLKDDSLVNVDTTAKTNYLKLSFPEGASYVWISDPNESAESRTNSQSVTGFPVKDSATLQPLDIPANGNKQFWVTVKVPENASPGIYTGKIRLTSANGDNKILTLSVNVLPFNLPEPDYDSAIYYCSLLDPLDVGSISHTKKSRVQLAAELKNMVEHGVTKPTLYQSFTDTATLSEYLGMRLAAGIPNDPLYYLGVGTGASITTIQNFLNYAIQNGIQEVYFYGKDEAQGDALLAQRDKWIQVHDIGGKVFVAGYKGQNYPLVGDIQDLFVCAFAPSADEAALWHSVGHKIWCYANPQGGVENPDIYRRNYGLLLWQNNYDGACTFAYQYGFSGGNIWNDFDHATYRDHNFTYPTVDGVIDTIAWEGYREGVDDIRYLTKLQQLIATAQASGDLALIDIANQATAYLDTIDAGKDDLDAVRAKMIDYIIKLN